VKTTKNTWPMFAAATARHSAVGREAFYKGPPAQCILDASGEVLDDVCCRFGGPMRF
jgi:hypothetical protein